MARARAEGKRIGGGKPGRTGKGNRYLYLPGALGQSAMAAASTIPTRRQGALVGVRLDTAVLAL